MFMLMVKTCQREIATDESQEKKIIESTAIEARVSVLVT